MLKINKNQISLVVTSVRDAIEYTSIKIENSSDEDEITDLEEYLVSLGLLEAWIEEEYRKLEKTESGMIPYNLLNPGIHLVDDD